jgi:hypothetical protein
MHLTRNKHQETEGAYRRHFWLAYERWTFQIFAIPGRCLGGGFTGILGPKISFTFCASHHYCYPPHNYLLPSTTTCLPQLNAASLSKWVSRVRSRVHSLAGCQGRTVWKFKVYIVKVSSLGRMADFHEHLRLIRPGNNPSPSSPNWKLHPPDRRAVSAATVMVVVTFPRSL